MKFDTRTSRIVVILLVLIAATIALAVRSGRQSAEEQLTEATRPAATARIDPHAAPSTAAARQSSQSDSPSAADSTAPSAAPVARDERPRQMGQTVEARVQVGDTTYDVRPNQVGSFQRINVNARQTAQVAAMYPQSEPGQTVIVEVQDGGNLGDGKRL